MFLINAQTQDRAYTRSLMSVKASTAFRSASKEDRVTGVENRWRDFHLR
jgi:hypothetical protein